MRSVKLQTVDSDGILFVSNKAMVIFRYPAKVEVKGEMQRIAFRLMLSSCVFVSVCVCGCGCVYV